MDALVLAAGEGKRMHPFSTTIPKSMLPVAGKPIIASNVGGIPEIFQDGTGYLIKPNVKSLYDKLSLLVEDDKLRKKLGAEGKKKVKGHSWTEVAKHTITVCERVLEN